MIINNNEMRLIITKYKEGKYFKKMKNGCAFK
jgi:hypothetical protein